MKIYEAPHAEYYSRENESTLILVHAGVKQGFLLFLLIFNIILDSGLLDPTTKQHGITWGLVRQLEDLDYVYDSCLLSHTFNDLQR